MAEKTTRKPRAPKAAAPEENKKIVKEKIAEPVVEVAEEIAEPEAKVAEEVAEPVAEKVAEEVPALEEIAEPKAAEKVAEEHIVLAKIYPSLPNSKYLVYVEYGKDKKHVIARRSYSKALTIAQSWCKTHGHSFSDIKVI